jgi:2-polyprenyl-3-methyl-5-hydroxy-6-metoxy-1,4-benzoquinol methylase
MKLPEARAGDADWSRLREHDVQELWDHSIRPHVASSYLARLSLLIDLIADRVTPRGRVLDVGCAQGTLGLMLAERGFRVTLLDVRAKNIEYARARYEHGDVDFHVGLLGDEMPPAGDFDAVVCTEVLEHITEPAALLASLAAKARPGGAVCLTTPNADYALSSLPTFGSASQAVIDGAESNSLDGDAHRFLYTKEELIALARGVGLRIGGHGFFLPAWLEGHAKTRHLHRLHFQLRRTILNLPSTMPAAAESLARRVCSSQWLVAERSA